MIIISLMTIVSAVVLLMILENFSMFTLPVAFIASLVALLFAGGAQLLRVSYYQDMPENKIVKYIGLIILLGVLGIASPYYLELWDHEKLQFFWGRLFLIWIGIEALFLILISVLGKNVTRESEEHAEV